MKNKTLWKSLRAGLISDYGNFKWKENKWYKIDGKLEICKKGFHASENIIDSMNYVNCEILAQVEVRGDSIVGNDKQCWSEMRVIKKWKWEKSDSIKLAIFAASRGAMGATTIDIKKDCHSWIINYLIREIL